MQYTKIIIYYSMHIFILLSALDDDFKALNKSLQNIVHILPSITEKEQAAGVENSQFYTPKMDYNQLHISGNTIEKDFLKYFFFNTIFQYYVHYFLAYDMTFNYDQFKNINQTKYDKNKFEEIKSKLNLNDLNEFKITDALLHAIENFKQNTLLEKLGIAYQRMKIVVEKLGTQLRINQSSESLYKALLEADRLTTDLQIMIFHMMESATELLKQNLKNANSDEKIFHAGDFLKTYQPDWIDASYYKNIIDQLDEIMKPKFSYTYKESGQADLIIPLH